MAVWRRRPGAPGGVENDRAQAIAHGIEASMRLGNAPSGRAYRRLVEMVGAGDAEALVSHYLAGSNQAYDRSDVLEALKEEALKWHGCS